ncbi:MAG TPA: zinc-binding alcohol dehydrogenase, partial [Planctomycetota bacterium]|nr:zinc-binding alcohol dehydrogenase [Planctomycetota bacterium]
MKVVMHRPNGSVYVGEWDKPVLKPRHVHCRVAFGWISSGTEGGFLRERRHNPSSDPKDYQLGYTASGEVIAAGAEATEFKPGMPVALYGSPHVFHGEEVSVGRNLAVPIPLGVSLMEASAVGIGAIALHGLRQVSITLGDVVVLYGLGPLGLIAAQLIEAMGGEVIGVDLLESRLKIARELTKGTYLRPGERDLKGLVFERTRGRGADAIVMSISGDQAVTDQLPALLRDRGRISLIGGSKTAFPNLTGADRKEIEIKYVRAGGPGRRDSIYEVDGFDYPVGYVPWTENRNMEAFLGLVA